MYRKSKIAIALVMCIGLITSGQSAQGYSPPISSVVTKPTTVTKAKSLIRSLYYGYQQASYQGWASHKKFILANNYPGMYTNPKGCLDKLSRYSDIMPDLSSVAKDANWKMPKGVYLNKLSGKKPAGETFVFQANDEGTQVFNHVTILKGKAYFFLWVCKKANPVVADTELTANRAYFSSLANLVDDENAIIAEYGSVTGANYTSDQAVYTMVVNIIPETQQYIARINTLPTGTTKLYQLNQTYLNAWSSYLNAFSTLKTALDRQDATLITKSNEYLMEARNFGTDFVSSASTFRR
jgi:hypothetical protein